MTHSLLEQQGQVFVAVAVAVAAAAAAVASAVPAVEAVV